MKVLTSVLVFIYFVPFCVAGEMMVGAFEIVCSCKQFQTGRIGEGGHKSRTASAYLGLAKQKDPAIFIKLFEAADSDAAKAYALQGLNEIDKNLFEKYSEKWDDAAVIKCLLFGVNKDISVREMKKLIRSGEIGRVLRWPE